MDRQADTPTPVMVEAGIAALQDFGGSEDFWATDPGLIVGTVFSAMLAAGQRFQVPAV